MIPKNVAIVAIQECSGGNEQVGDMWQETGIFPPETPIEKVLEWANDKRGSNGRLIITVADNFVEAA